MDKETEINELDIKDEFLLAESTDGLDKISRMLQELDMQSGDGGAILITQNNEVIGFVTDNEIVDLVAEGKDPAELHASDIMNTDYVEVLEYETLRDIIPIIKKQFPNAIVVINDDRQCVGLFSKNDYEEALARVGVYDESRTPKTSKEWQTRGIALSNIGKKIDALKSFERSIRSARDKKKGWKDLAARLEKINSYKEAIMCLDKSVSINPDDDKALAKRGELYSKEQTKNLAIHSYRLALSINPENVTALMNMGQEQSNAGEIEEAMKCFEKAGAIKGENPELWFRKGSAFEKAKKYDEALNCYDNAIKMNGAYEEAWFSKGVTLDRQGKDKEALNCFEEILKINPNNRNAKNAVDTFMQTGAFQFS